MDLIDIDNYSFQLIVKVGISFSEDSKTEASEIFNKAKIAADQGESYQSGIYNYDSDFDNKRKLFYEISSSLFNAIKNNELYIVYQPIIDIKNNSISSVEVLARWDRGNREPIGPDTFIKIAEETGSIQRITKEIIKQHINQLVDWEKRGIKVKSSVNLTVSEIIDDFFHQWAKNIIYENNIDSCTLGIEITERVFSRNRKKLNDVLIKLQDKGYIISIDDFGTGYNAFKEIEKIKANIIKIDKYFIDQIDQKYTKNLVRYVIDCVHEMGLLVVAEGVETKEQLMILKELGCDKIQGYYFSKPLLPDDFIDYYTSFDMDKYI